ncbi:leucine-zipper-like transcriptional regulator 1 [Anaeramoeba ignava]|uniref:Leucine-zipper-like transcriptional regulator 1 n=1 Tax=Anaeramoeba ignava TaxID=1746090 RepID=A0A9Q0LKY0_ANAIG|nr:leucine-zipper-like transcriptional regulator 1 [Anaeramoeba ignava]
MNFKWEYPKTKFSNEKIKERCSHFGCVYGNEIIIAGGSDQEDNHLNDIWTFSPRTLEWKRLDINLPSPLSCAGMCEHNSKIYIFGGLFQMNRYLTFETNSFIRIDLESKKVEEIESETSVYPSHRYHPVFECFGDSIYIIWGRNTSEILPDYYRFDIKTEKWKLLGKPKNDTQGYPNKRILCSTAIKDNFLIVFGGLVDDEVHVNDFWFFNFKTETWMQKTNFFGKPPSPRRSHKMVVMNQLMIFFGGYHPDFEFFNDSYVFDFSTDTWSQIITDSPLPPPRRVHLCFPDLYSNQMITFGGIGDDYKRFDDLFVLKIPTQSSLSSDLQNLFVRQELCDLKINQEYSVHKDLIESRVKSINKFLLATREYKQKQELKDFLIFLYSGILPTIPSEKFNEILEKTEIKTCDQNSDPNLNYQILLKNDLKKLYSLVQEKDNLPKNSTLFEIIVKNEKTSEEQSLWIHKFILLSRSELFRGMFLCVEDDKNSVQDLSQRSYQSLKAFVHFLYLDSLPNDLSIENALELIDATEYYGLSNDYFTNLLIDYISQKVEQKDASILLPFCEIYPQIQTIYKNKFKK